MRVLMFLLSWIVLGWLVAWCTHSRSISPRCCLVCGQWEGHAEWCSVEGGE